MFFATTQLNGPFYISCGAGAEFGLSVLHMQCFDETQLRLGGKSSEGESKYNNRNHRSTAHASLSDQNEVQDVHKTHQTGSAIDSSPAPLTGWFLDGKDIVLECLGGL